MLLSKGDSISCFFLGLIIFFNPPSKNSSTNNSNAIVQLEEMHVPKESYLFLMHKTETHPS